MCDKKLKEAFEKQGVRVLKSDNICIGGRIPLLNGKVGIIAENTELTNAAKK